MSGGNGVPRAPARPPMWRDSADVNFVRAWSGGKDGDMLDYLERFERSLTTKRMISADDMQALSAVQRAGVRGSGLVAGATAPAGEGHQALALCASSCEAAVA